VTLAVKQVLYISNPTLEFLTWMAICQSFGNDLNHYFFRQIFEPAQNGNKCGRDRHRSGGALRCVFLLAEKVRNANGEGSRWKSASNKTHM
jgi:hypothetical protein